MASRGHADPDALYAAAEPRAGYFTASGAATAGYSRSLLSYHVRSGVLERVDHGIYRLKRFPESPRADLVVAELRVGPEGAVSHESALELYGLSDALPTQVHVTVPRTASRRRRGVRLHTGRLELEDVTTRDSVTVTTVERTIADVARSGFPERLVVQAIDQAVDRGLTTPALLARYVGRRGGRAKKLVDLALARIEQDPSSHPSAPVQASDNLNVLGDAEDDGGVVDRHERIEANPEVCHGKASIRGTRIPVTVVLDNLAAGLSTDEILAEYPGLQTEDVLAAVAYAADIARERLVPLRESA